MIAVLFAVGVVGLFMDWRYVRRGGVQPTVSEKRTVWIVIALVLAVAYGLALLGASARGMGFLAAQVTEVIVFLWSAWRSWVRSSFPIPSVPKG